MKDKSTETSKFKATFEEAAKVGYSNFEYDGMEFTIVVPGQETASGTHPFIGFEHFVRLQKSRAAYSDRMAWVMAELANLAYIRFEESTDKKNALVKALTDGGFVKPVFFNSDFGTQAFLAVKPGDFAVLVFRGTEANKADILADLDARFLETPDGKAHKGFSRAFEAVEADVRAALTRLMEEHADISILVSGHSLGGAIATAATQVLEEDFQTIAACYTYGSPRIGTAEWSDSVKSPVYRIVNGADGVPLVPFTSVFRDGVLWLFNIPFIHALKPYAEKFFEKGFAGFQHAGDMRFVMGGDDPKLKIGSSAVFARFRHITIGMISRVLYGIGNVVGVKALSAFFADHSIGTYASRLKSIANERNP